MVSAASDWEHPAIMVNSCTGKVSFGRIDAGMGAPFENGAKRWCAELHAGPLSYLERGPRAGIPIPSDGVRVKDVDDLCMGIETSPISAARGDSPSCTRMVACLAGDEAAPQPLPPCLAPRRWALLLRRPLSARASSLFPTR